MSVTGGLGGYGGTAMLRIARLPGVFTPLSDTWLLAAAARAEPRLRGGRVLDLCTGSGAVASRPRAPAPAA